MASGSEVHPVLAAAELLRKEGIKARVVNMACFEYFDGQPDSYRKKVLPPAVDTRLAVEAGAMLSWYKYARPGAMYRYRPLRRIGAAKVLFQKFGFTVDNIVTRAKKLLKR